MNQKKKIYFALLFTVLGLVFSRIKFTQMMGANVSFTLFDFFAPVAGAFLGGLYGVFSALIVSVINLIANNTYSVASIIRIYPTLFAVYYFSMPANRKNKLMPMIALVSMILFWANPVGRQVWYYALLWLIPVVSYFKRDWLYLRSLGATFTAHAVGGAAWIWALQMPASVWRSLIPVVMTERLLFAGGISVSYLLVRQGLKILSAKKLAAGWLLG